MQGLPMKERSRKSAPPKSAKSTARKEQGAVQSGASESARPGIAWAREAILDAAKDLLVIVLDRGGRIVHFNQACQELTRYSMNKVKGRRIWDFLAVPEEIAESMEIFRELVGGARRQGRMHIITRDGRRRLIAWSNSVVLDDRGGVRFVICAGIDVTERHEAKEQARESKAILEALLETAACAVVADRGGQIVLANPATEKMFGYRPHELIGQPEEILLPESVRALYAARRTHYFSQLHDQAGALAFDLAGVRKDGSEFPVQINLSSIMVKEGLLGVNFISDITERKMSEATLLEYQKELRALTARLLGVQEAGNKELARELHDALSQKLAALGMEVSTLLRPSAKSPNSLPERVRSLSAHINALAEEVQAMSRRLHPAILDELGLEAALREECAGFSAQEGVRAQLQSERVPSSLPEDVSLCLYRVAQESLRNIAKHAKATNVRVVLAGRKEGITLRTEDTGDGFDLKEVKDKGRLGLISMEERVRLVSGKLMIRSRPGHGTTVEVFVPLHKKTK
jgi:PAS domain S-box-containing protein